MNPVRIQSNIRSKSQGDPRRRRPLNGINFLPLPNMHSLHIPMSRFGVRFFGLILTWFAFICMSAMPLASLFAQAVTQNGEWLTGLVHPAPAGTSRLLVFTAHSEGAGDLESVSYGGQPMTKVNAATATTGGVWAHNQAAAFILDEAGIQAASSDTFVVQWEGNEAGEGYASAFFDNVDQGNPVEASAVADSISYTTPTQVTTAPLDNTTNDLLIVAAVCGDNSTLSLHNGFQIATSVSVSSGRGIVGSQIGTGTPIAPAASKSASGNRLAVLGFALRSIAAPMTSEQIAARFLTQATFGPTYDEIQALASEIDVNGEMAALEAWIDAEFAKPHTSLRDLFLATGGGNYVRVEMCWWTNAIDADDQLRQRMAYSLHQILVTNLKSTRQEEGFCAYYDMLASNSFGNYRDVLFDTTMHPIMGKYLSHLRNGKADPVLGTNPDENFAREVMQLFSIGLFELNTDGSRKQNNGEDIPTYTNAQITEFAEVFTGLYYPKTKSWHTFYGYVPRNMVDPMYMYDEAHDMSEKVLLNGLVLPAGQSGMDDINDAIDNLFDHPNVGPFIGRLLIQRLITSNPTAAYISRVSDAFAGNGPYGIGVRGDMKAVVKSILLDEEARSAALLADDAHGRNMEPILRTTQLARAYKMQKELDGGGAPKLYYNFVYTNNTLGMRALQSPSVFNFYLPDFQPAGAIGDLGLVGPEFEIMTDYYAISVPNEWKKAASGENFGSNYNVHSEKLDLTEMISFASTATDAEIVNRIDLIQCRGLMTMETYDEILAAVASVATAEEKVELGIYLAAISAESAVLR